MHTWHWQTWNDLPYLTCSLLEPWSHGFFTQQFWQRSPAELTTILHPTARAYRVKQVHGNTVLAPSDVETLAVDSEFPPADGLITEQTNQAVWACSADCTPVLIADDVTGQVAAVHAGWRGTSLKIVPQAIARLRQQGSQLQDLRVAMGPAIAGDVYQVSEHVAAEVGATVVAIDPKDTTTLLAALRQLPDSPLLEDPEPGRVRLDVRRVNALQLEQLGLRAEQITIAPYCTYKTPDRFFSYRRSREKESAVVWHYQPRKVDSVKQSLATQLLPEKNMKSWRSLRRKHFTSPIKYKQSNLIKERRDHDVSIARLLELN